MIAGNFFKEKVIIKIQINKGWTIFQFHTVTPKWNEMLKNAVAFICSSNLFFDDYLISNRYDNLVKEISINADLKDVFYDFLINRHGFSQGHQNDNQKLSDWLKSESFLFKKFTEKQFEAFLNDFEKIKIAPDGSELLDSASSYA